MPEHLISKDAAEVDLLAAAAYVGEGVKSSDGTPKQWPPLFRGIWREAR
jgi:hypothetical protein